MQALAVGCPEEAANERTGQRCHPEIGRTQSGEAHQIVERIASGADIGQRDDRGV